MTCIVGVVGDDRIVLGADSAWSGRNVTQPRTTAKLFRKECWDGSEMLVGGSGCGRTLQVLNHVFEVPELRPKVDVDAYMATSFANAVRKALKDNGAIHVENSRETMYGSFLVAWKKRLFLFESNFQAIEPVEKYDATGSGHEYALGAVGVLIDTPALSPVLIVRRAMEATARHCPTVGRPFIIEELMHDDSTG